MIEPPDVMSDPLHLIMRTFRASVSEDCRSNDAKNEILADLLGNSNYGDFGSLVGAQSRYYRTRNGRMSHYSGMDLEKEAEMKKTGFFKGLFRKKNKPIYGVDSTFR